MEEFTVEYAFKALEGALKAEIASLQLLGTRELDLGNFSSAEDSIQRAHRLIQLLAKVRAVREEWERLALPTQQRESTAFLSFDGEPRDPAATPEQAFRRPILEALVEMGGAGRVSEVLDRVEVKLANALTPLDRAPLPESNAIRWRNRAQWCRLRLVRKGLLRSDSRSGIWEISERGRQALEDGTV